MNIQNGDLIKLKDGSEVYLKSFDIDDAKLLIDFYKHLSPDSMYNRFFVFKGELSHEDAKKIAFVSHKGEIVIVGILKSDPPVIIADARLYLEGDKAEVGIVVQDKWQNKGIGSALMRLLISKGKDENLRHIRIYCLPDNVVMVHVGENLGFRPRTSDLGISRMDLDL